MAKTYTEGLSLTWPVKSDTNYDAVADTSMTAISEHAHTGTGDGLQLSAGSLAANAVTGAKVRLANNEAMRALNAAGAADVDLLKLTTGNLLSLLAPLVLGSTATETATGTTAIALTTTITVLNKASGAASLADGTEGQIKFIVNINSATCVVTPATTAGVNTATLVQRGTVMYVFLSSEWRAFAGAGCTLA